jgi:hypothetical protein
MARPYPLGDEASLAGLNGHGLKRGPEVAEVSVMRTQRVRVQRRASARSSATLEESAPLRSDAARHTELEAAASLISRIDALLDES